MLQKLRVARATNELQRISEMYCQGLGMEVLSKFAGHQGFSGVIIGRKGEAFHLEFTQEEGTTAPRSNSHEDLLVFYIPDSSEFSSKCKTLIQAGFKTVKAHNPYWEANGQTFEDPEGYRIVICKLQWKS